jgi:hypothetical protein
MSNQVARLIPDYRPIKRIAPEDDTTHLPRIWVDLGYAITCAADGFIAWARCNTP